MSWSGGARGRLCGKKRILKDQFNSWAFSFNAGSWRGSLRETLVFQLSFSVTPAQANIFHIFIPTSLLPLSDFNAVKFSKDPPLILLWICVFREVWRRITGATIVLVKENSLQRTLLSTFLKVSAEKAPNDLGASRKYFNFFLYLLSKFQEVL